MLLVLALAGCSPVSAPVPSGSATPPAASPSASPTPVQFNQELHDELVAMLARDQSERMGGPQEEGDYRRTERLKEIIEEFGWPTILLVGKEGEDAAWAIAQHSDLDPAFQADALELLRAAVEQGVASPGNLAYLEDRVAVGQGEPQTYGTQVGCGPDGPEPATPIKDEANVEERRAAAGLAPLSEYLAEMAALCAEDFG